jgi:transposase-like protein
MKNKMIAVYMAQRRATPKVEHYTATVSKLAKRFGINSNLPQAGMRKVYAGAPVYKTAGHS